MKKQLLLLAAFCGIVAGTSTKTEAQAIATLGPRLIVNVPSNIEGNKDFTYSSDLAYAGPWGRALDSTWYMVPLIKAYTPDTFQSSPATPNAYANKWVLIFRGNNINFSDKALYAQQAGAKGVIIVNNVPGADAVGMGAVASGASVTIPVLMVSNPDGLALDAALNAMASGGDSVKVSLTEWGFGFNNDLSIVPHSTPFPHGGALPLSQLGATGGMAQPYNMYNGGIIANVGLNDASSVMMNTDITWTPTGGAASSVYHDSVAITGSAVGVITAIDSLGASYAGAGDANGIYHPTATQTGMYTINSYVHSDNVDQNPFDDSTNYSMYVTDSVFCKGRWDNTIGAPKTTGAVGFSPALNGGAMTWGPLFYITNGGFTASKFQFSVADNDTSKHDLSQQPQVYVFMYKWVDGAGGGTVDNTIQFGELTLAGIASRAFSTSDSDGQALTFDINDANGTVGTTTEVDSNSWYWFAADMGTLAMGVDNNANYFGRQNAAAANNITEYGAPNYNGSATAFQNGGTATLDMNPFINDTVTLNNLGFRTFDNLIPAAALHISKHFVSVKNVNAAHSSFTLYPNPATDVLHVKLALLHASNVEFNIADATGHTMLREKHSNVQNDDISFSTSKLAPGQYYMVISTTDGPAVRPFTVLAK